jgi:CDP-4-dehydro-6-deoxyglucose reductase, E3
VSFIVTLKPSGRTFDVGAGVSVLTAAEEQHISLPYGCRLGTCCSCRGKVISGAVDLGNAHPAYLTQAQRDDGYALLCQATPLSNVTIEIEELPLLSEPLEFPAMVRAIEFLSADVAKITLRLPLHQNLKLAAGQYVDLTLAGGIRRSYSVANAPKLINMIDLEFHVRHMPGGAFTDHVFSELKVRDRIQCKGPLGTFFLRDSEKPAIMLASGTGYAPIRSILLDQCSRHSKREFVLYWGGRTRQDLYLSDEVDALVREHTNIRYVPVLSDSTAACNWTGRSGFVHRAVMEDYPDMSGIQVYACGAPIMVDAARRDFTEICSLPTISFFADSFVTSADVAANEGPASRNPAPAVEGNRHT